MARKTNDQIKAELEAAFTAAPDGALSYVALAATVSMTPQHLQVLNVIATGEVVAVPDGVPTLIYRLNSVEA